MLYKLFMIAGLCYDAQYTVALTNYGYVNLDLIEFNFVCLFVCLCTSFHSYHVYRYILKKHIFSLNK